jgi:hypothetical protein
MTPLNAPPRLPARAPLTAEAARDLQKAYHAMARSLTTMTESRNREAGQALELAMANKRLRGKLQQVFWVGYSAILLLTVVAIVGWLT